MSGQVRRSSQIMNKIIQIAILLPAALITGCSTPYATDRGRDAADIFTVAVGTGAGVKARVSFINVGAFSNADKQGLRGGQYFAVPKDYRRGDMPQEFTSPIPLGKGFVPLCHADQFDHHLPALPNSLRHARGKSVNAYSIIPFTAWPENRGTKLAYLCQLEAAVGLGGTLRIGFNPGELLDFILGWTTIDIFDDDLERRKQKERIEQ